MSRGPKPPPLDGSGEVVADSRTSPGSTAALSDSRWRKRADFRVERKTPRTATRGTHGRQFK